MSNSYERIGNASIAMSNLAAALQAFSDALAIRQQLSQDDPSNAQWQRDLSVSHAKLAQVQERLGDSQSAIINAEIALNMGERLAAMDSTNATWQQDVALNRRQVERLKSQSD